jgi:hypothetical protein
MMRTGRQRLNLKGPIVRGGGGGLEKTEADVETSHIEASATQSALTMTVPTPIGSRAA